MNKPKNKLGNPLILLALGVAILSATLLLNHSDNTALQIKGADTDNNQKDASITENTRPLITDISQPLIATTNAGASSNNKLPAIGLPTTGKAKKTNQLASVKKNIELVDAQQAKLNDNRHSYEMRVIDRLLERFHYKSFLLDDSLSQMILKNYIDSLDPFRSFFLASDIEEFQKLEDNFDDYIRHGITKAYHSIFDVYRKRVDERIDYAIERLEHNFNFTAQESYTIDRSESPWSNNLADIQSLWRKRIKNDLINLELTGEDEEKALETLRKRYQSIAKRTAQIKDNELFQIYINAYASAIEPHTSYFSPRASEEFNISMRLSLQGIGAVLRSVDEQTTIVNVVPGGPADQSGQLHAEDKILAVAQGKDGEMVDIIGWRLSDVVNIIRGEKGSTVRLSILPAALGANAVAKDLILVRDEIKLENQAAKSRIMEVQTDSGQSKLGIIDLPSFYIDFDARRKGDPNYRSTTRDVADLLNELKTQNVDGIIIDLRGNGGGSLEEVVSLTGLFIDQGPIVQVKSSDGRTQTHRDMQRGVVYDGPLAVMVNRQSASASEIFAGAIQDYGRGLIIGEPTFGKGTVQNVLSLSDYAKQNFKDQLGQIKITVAQFFRINGDSTQHRGVTPDIQWPYSEAQLDYGERALDNALPWRHIAESDYALSKYDLPDENLSLLKKQSTARTQNNDSFIAALNKHDLILQARNEKTISLNKQTRKRKRESFNQQLLATENQLRSALGQSTYASIKEMRETQEKERDKNAYSKAADKNPPDVFLTEAGNILNDFLHLNLMLLAQNENSLSN